MTALRKLSAIYIAAASTYAVAIALAHHPVWNANAHIAGRFAAEQGEAAAIALNDHVLTPGYVWARHETARGYRALVATITAPRAQVTAKPPAVHAAKHRLAKAVPAAKPQVPVLRPNAATSWSHPVAHTPRASVTLDLAPPKNPPPTDRSPGPAELARAAQRLKDSLTHEMLANFDLFLYVSMADKGPLAQRMYVFAKKTSDDLALRYDWPVSTGREAIERNPNGVRMTTDTPQGYYELDPRRMYRHYTSFEWKKPMPYAMFFNWVHDGRQTGLAIHGAYGEDIALLGRRASAGCVHLAPENAAVLFDLIRTRYRGEVPVFAYDEKTASASNTGFLQHDAKGNLRYAMGYKVLVVIENYGGENTVAALM